MSFKNIHYDRGKGKMYLGDDEIESNRNPKVFNGIPYCYVKAGQNTGIKSIFGDNVIKKCFTSFPDYKSFFTTKDADGNTVKIKNDGTRFENEVKPEIQFLVDMYYSIPDDQIHKPQIHFSIIDIEVDTTKIDNNKIVKCKTDSGEDYYTLSEINRLHKKPKIFDEETKKGVEFSENYFLSSYGFPDPNLAERPISAITIYNSKINKIYTFAYKQYTGELLSKDGYRYIQCENERSLIDKFLTFMEKTTPDVITGGNLYKFDIAYIINRIRRLDPGRSSKKSSTVDGLMDNTSPKARTLIDKLSPINIVTYGRSTEKSDVTKSSEMRTNVDIAGVSILDYLDLYKMYSTSRLESFTLDFVSKYELEKGKLEYEEYKNLVELYHYNFNKFIEYNVVDVERVKQLQEKLGYIELVQALSLLTKCPMKFYNAVTHLSEAAFLTYYRRNNLCAPYAPDGTKKDFEAGYVKKPAPALYGGLVDLDITSSYPAQMITMNMGLETYQGAIYQFIRGTEKIIPTEKEIVECVRGRQFPPFSMISKQSSRNSDVTTSESIEIVSGENLKKFNEKLQNGKYVISPNGIIFRTDIKGTIAEVERYMFYKRVEVRAKQKEIGTLRDKISDKNTKEYQKLDIKLNQLKNLQLALKLVLNGTFGAISVPYFRLFNSYIAEAITAGGRHSVKNGEYFTNEVMDDPSKSQKLSAILTALAKEPKC